jgi:hypothetical protein
VLSEEGALGSMWDVYAAAPARAPGLQQALGESIDRIIVYFRPQLNWLESVYAQRVQRGESLHPEQFLTHVLDAPMLHWDRLAQCLLEAFGPERVDLRAYPGPLGVVDDFVRATDLNCPAHTGEPRENVSISPRRLAVLRALNERDPSDRWRQRRWLLQRILPPKPSPFEESVFSADAQREILERFEPSWRRLEALSSNSEALKRVWTLAARRRPLKTSPLRMDQPDALDEMLALIDACATLLAEAPPHESSLSGGFARQLRRILLKSAAAIRPKERS